MKASNKIFVILIICLVIGCGESAAQPGKSKLVKVKIYLLDNFESENLLENLKLMSVEREVSAKFPLRAALEAQLKGATEEENSQLLYSPISEINLVSVKVKNKTAYASFTQNEKEPLDKTRALRFRNAVRQTALQFPSVRRIEICLDGISDFWLIGAKTHKKCQ